MATNTKNVIVGAASLFISSQEDESRPATTNAIITGTTANGGFLTSGASARTGLLATGSKYREVGYTNSGLEISYEPNYGEVMVDQLLDAAKLFKQTLKVTLKTELVEATLDNLTLSWGQMDTYYVNQTGSSITAVNSMSDTTPVGGSEVGSTLNMAAGALGDAPVERTLVAIGNAPAQVKNIATTSNTSTLRNKERVYIARRVVSMDTTAHGLKRDSATVFPVSFRCLPDDSQASYAGSEYGVVIDRVWGTN
jgi:hypothetical protein